MRSHVRTALVTGANRGIGLAIAEGLAAQRIRVLAAARSEESAQEAAAGIGAGAIGVELPLDDPLEVERQARRITDAHGPVDILVNNAGILADGRGLEATTADLIESLMINAASPFALIRMLGEAMKARGWGRIVNLSSGWGSFDEGLRGPLAYSVSKAALNAITFAMSGDLGPQVKINAAGPGWVRTRMGGQAAARSPEEGADTPIWLATLPDDGPTGGFFRDRSPIPW